MSPDLPETVYNHLVARFVEHGFGDKLIKYGSYYVCNPPSTNTDVDFFIRVARLKEFEVLLEEIGFKQIESIGLDSSRPTWGDSDPDRRFSSYKMGIFNLVATESEVFSVRHNAATSICKKLNLLDKKDRIMVYQAVLYGKAYNEA
jgi:hypothetical protein